ncbi:MAG TPA: ethylbenzene dehydrogenase-related protein, partial [Methylomirabilota bacterium]|nr:ethylbenzene dehydrogenase-related protein [Methylomirabilota bacterium]
TPVENLVAAGFGTLTTADEQRVAGEGLWQSGRWYVLFSREMGESMKEYAPLEAGSTTNVAFAVWDGAAGERDGLKSVSQFADLKIEGTPGEDGGGAAVVWVFVMAGVIIVVMAIAYTRLRRGWS